MAILEERGLFWWSDEPVLEHQFAPDSCLTGLLTIDDDGRTRLELDGYFPSKHGPMTSMMRRGQPIAKDIQGLLKTSNKHVLLTWLTGNGGQFSTNGMSYERYIAEQCLVADGFAKLPAALAFKELIVPLAGFEEWLRLAAIKVNSSKRMVTVKYKRPKDAVYPTADGKLTIHFESEADSSGAVFGTALSLKESASAALGFKTPLALKDIIAQYQLLEDLLLLLTGSDHTLDWPWMAAGKTVQYRLYFPKLGTKAASPPPKAHECVTNFVQLRERFGDIWSNWKKKREVFGPGFYLYLGTRRGIRLYIENRFANLVFGLEAFNRRKYPPAIAAKLDAKIERIVAQVSLAKDKKWLADILDRAKEPPLGQRLYTTLRDVSLGLDEARLKNFCEVCAKLRNDISHFGGQRHDGTPYNDFILDLESKAQALAALYQALLLHEIGVDVKIIKAWMFDGFGSLPIKYHFVESGLLDKSVLDAPHQNNFGLGQHGRSRTNVWQYRGVNAFGKDRSELLGVHPTCKPVTMIADALLDVSRRGEIVLDPFLGSGSTLIAAETVGRICIGNEIDPVYCDVTIRRWQKQTGRDAVNAATGETFAAAAERIAMATTAAAPAVSVDESLIPAARAGGEEVRHV
jgi:hypothetical protein